MIKVDPANVCNLAPGNFASALRVVAQEFGNSPEVDAILRRASDRQLEAYAKLLTRKKGLAAMAVYNGLVSKRERLREQENVLA